MEIRISIKNEDISVIEKKEILRLLQKLKAKRRRDQKPRLKYVVDFRNQ